MSQGTKQIRDGLISLMTRQTAWQGKFTGTPFVNSEKEFGITMETTGGSLYAMHHLIDSLNCSDFFEGDRADKTDLDSMVYRFDLGETQIYDGVIASRTENVMALTINTSRSVEETLNAISVGVETAQAALDRTQEESQQYADNVRSEFAKEDALPLFNKETDTEFVKCYLKEKAASHFSSDPNTVVSDPLPAQSYSADTFASYGVTDKRPRFKVKLNHTEENYTTFNDFHNAALGNVFTGPLAINIRGDQNTEQDLSFEVNGNPSRLARDIVQNDPELAVLVAHIMTRTLAF